MRYISIIFILLLFVSCGVILDPLRVVGTWELTDVEFYVYNPVFDSIKTLYGTDDNTPDAARPVMSEFFGLKRKGNYSITFESQNNNFKVQLKNTENDLTDDDDPDGLIIVDEPDGSWEVNTFENSLSLEVNKDSAAGSELWNDGFYIKNFWPMTNYQTLEILIKDGGRVGPLYVDLKNETKRILSMKGIFTKQE